MKGYADRELEDLVRSAFAEMMPQLLDESAPRIDGPWLSACVEQLRHHLCKGRANQVFQFSICVTLHD